MVSYNTARYEEALGQYRSALATPAGEQMRVLNGIYLTNIKLNRMTEAETAFGRVVVEAEGTIFGIQDPSDGVGPALPLDPHVDLFARVRVERERAVTWRRRVTNGARLAGARELAEVADAAGERLLRFGRDVLLFARLGRERAATEGGGVFVGPVARLVELTREIVHDPRPPPSGGSGPRAGPMSLGRVRR